MFRKEFEKSLGFESYYAAVQDVLYEIGLRPYNTNAQPDGIAFNTETGDTDQLELLMKGTPNPKWNFNDPSQESPALSASETLKTILPETNRYEIVNLEVAAMPYFL